MMTYGTDRSFRLILDPSMFSDFIVKYQSNSSVPGPALRRMNGIKYPPAAELLGSGLLYHFSIVRLTVNFLVCAFFGLRNQRMLGRHRAPMKYSRRSAAPAWAGQMGGVHCAEGLRHVKTPEGSGCVARCFAANGVRRQYHHCARPTHDRPLSLSCS